MALLQEAAHAVSNAAGWRTPVSDAQGTIHFVMKDGLSMTLLSSDGRTAVFCSEILALPPGETNAAPLLEKAARLAVGSMKKRRSILSLRENQLMLHSSLRLDSPMQLFPETARHFLNDLAWWRAQLSEDSAKASSADSLFSMSVFGFRHS